jgi:hypothetical protein
MKSENGEVALPVARRVILACVLIVLVGAAFAGDAFAQKLQNVIVSNKAGQWRVYHGWEIPSLLTPDGKRKPMRGEPDPRRPVPYEKLPVLKVRPATPPGPGWFQPDFEDVGWPRVKGMYGKPVAGQRETFWSYNNPAQLKFVCLRGRFETDVPKQCTDLQVHVTYHGGVIVFVNGVEIKRQHVRGTGFDPGMEAEPYPMKAYIKKGFEPLAEVRRRRVIAQIQPKHLRKGVNVVAVAVVRAPVRAVLEAGKVETWGHAAVLSAEVGSGYGLTTRKMARPYVVKVVNHHGEPKSHILNNTQGYWRLFTRWRTPELIDDEGHAAVLRRRPRRGRDLSKEKPVPMTATPAPVDGWAKPDFDDSDWARIRGTLGAKYGGGNIWDCGNVAELSLVCARGRFGVEDPADCKDLEVVAEYHGGAVIYVNGRELARGHLPDGDLTPDTLADPYPKTAYVQPNGKLLSSGNEHSRKGGLAKYMHQQRHRVTKVRIPPDALRKGTNVVAIAVRRSPYRALATWGQPWSHAVLLRATVRSTTGDAAASNAVRNLGPREGPQLWVHPVEDVVSHYDYPDNEQPARVLRLAGCRGGAYCGQVILSCDEPLSRFAPVISDLKADGASIPAKAVEIYYAKSNRDWINAGDFQTLDPDPPSAVKPHGKSKRAVQPIWLKVYVPRDAKPGTYKATLTVRYKYGTAGVNVIDGKPFAVPVELTVHDWTLPPPREWRTFIDLIQSPETVAIRYQTPLWSDEHFERLVPSMKLLGELGDRCIYVRMLTRSHFGDSQTMIRYVRDADGKLKPDFTVFARYLDLFEKYRGKPNCVILYLWCRYTARGVKGKHERYVPMATEFDPKTGQAKEVKLPTYGTPEGEAFWKPVIAEIRAFLTKRGYGDRAIFGLIGDFTGMSKEMKAWFAKVGPGLGWVWQGHGGARMGFYATTVWNARGTPDPRYGRSYGWRIDWFRCQFARDIWRTRGLVSYRQAPEHNITGGQRGIGRLGGDFWQVLQRGQKAAHGRHTAGMTLVNRWEPYGSWGQLVVRSAFLAPGKDGAIPTAPFELLRESLQDCQTRIFIARALLDKEQRAKLGGDLATKAQAMLDHRRMLLAHAFRGSTALYLTGRHARQNDLYATAAAVATALEHK